MDYVTDSEEQMDAQTDRRDAETGDARCVRASSRVHFAKAAKLSGAGGVSIARDASALMASVVEHGVLDGHSVMQTHEGLHHSNNLQNHSNNLQNYSNNWQNHSNNLQDEEEGDGELLPEHFSQPLRLSTPAPFVHFNGTNMGLSPSEIANLGISRSGTANLGIFQSGIAKLGISSSGILRECGVHRDMATNTDPTAMAARVIAARGGHKLCKWGVLASLLFAGLLFYALFQLLCLPFATVERRECNTLRMERRWPFGQPPI